MDYIDRYRKKTKRVYPDKALNPFIALALNKIAIRKTESGDSVGEDLEAVLIFKDKDGPDLGILYTYKDDGLEIGDVVLKTGAAGVMTDSYYMLVEEVKRVDASEIIRVFNVYEVNAWLNREVRLPVYIVSNLKKSISVADNPPLLKEGKNALVIYPEKYNLEINNKLNFTNAHTGYESYSSWKLIGKDDISSPNIVYGYLEQILKTNDDDTGTIEDIPVNQHKIGSVVELNSLDGYIRTTAKIFDIKRSKFSVSIRLPLEPGIIEIEVKDANGEIIKKTLEVVK